MTKQKNSSRIVGEHRDTVEVMLTALGPLHVVVEIDDQCEGVEASIHLKPERARELAVLLNLYAEIAEKAS